MSKIKDAWNALPTWSQKAITDFIETFIAVVVTLNIVIPSTLPEAKAQGLLVGAAALTALIAAARRAAPAAWEWLVALWQAA
jgi:hypothetical protein